MKVFIVLMETYGGHHETALLIMRKIYQREGISVRRYSDTDGLSDVKQYNTEEYSRAADLFLSQNDASYKKMISFGEVKMV